MTEVYLTDFQILIRDGLMFTKNYFFKVDCKNMFIFCSSTSAFGDCFFWGGVKLDLQKLAQYTFYHVL